MSHPHLQRPPIIEALLELRVRGGAVSDDVFARFEEAYGERYPQSQETGGRLAQLLRMTQGRRLSDADDRESVTLGPDRFTFSRRYAAGAPPYDTWRSFVDAAFETWEPFRSVVAPDGLTRVATRFLNRIHLPSGVGLAEVLSPPPAPLSQGDAGFTDVSDRRSARTHDGFGLQLGRRWNPGSGILIDVEVFRAFPSSEPRPIPDRVGDLDDVLERIDHLKNSLFFGALTPGALDPYRHA